MGPALATGMETAGAAAEAGGKHQHLLHAESETTIYHHGTASDLRSPDAVVVFVLCIVSPEDCHPG